MLWEMNQNDRFCSKTNWLWPKTLAAFFILSICLFCQYNLYRMSRGKSQETHLKCILIPRGNSLHLGWPLVIGSLKTYLNTRWKQGLFNFSWTKKTPVQLWIMLCVAMWHKTTVTIVNDCYLLSILLSFSSTPPTITLSYLLSQHV